MTRLSRPDTFAVALPALFERIYAHETSFFECVVPVIDTLRETTGWDRAIYSEVRRVPQFSEVIHVSEDAAVPHPLLPREIPCPDYAALDFAERSCGLVELSAQTASPALASLSAPESILHTERLVQGFMRAHGIQRAVYAPKRLTPNFVLVITLHRSLDDAPLSDGDREAIKLAHIVLKEIIQRKRWRFRVPGHSADHDRIMTMLAAGWDIARIATTLGRPVHEVRALRDHIMIELENQYGLRTPEAAVIFLRGELAKPV